MALSQHIIKQLAEHLETAELQQRDVTKITDDYPDMEWADAYAIQYAIRNRKLARGQRLSGLKMGLTSRAKMKQMGVEVPIFGLLMDYFAQPDAARIKVSELIHPKIEAEIAFVTKAPLKGPGCHIGDVLAATDFVLPAVEVLDSRYRDFKCRSRTRKVIRTRQRTARARPASSRSPNRSARNWPARESS
jgi:2-oxo-3-hexenedioate decarboxylase